MRTVKKTHNNKLREQKNNIAQGAAVGAVCPASFPPPPPSPPLPFPSAPPPSLHSSTPASRELRGSSGSSLRPRSVSSPLWIPRSSCRCSDLPSALGRLVFEQHRCGSKGLGRSFLYRQLCPQQLFSFGDSVVAYFFNIYMAVSLWFSHPCVRSHLTRPNCL